LWFRVGSAAAFCTAGARRTSHETLFGFDQSRPDSEFFGERWQWRPADPFDLPKAVQTCLICHEN
jgi:hypothetical protein